MLKKVHSFIKNNINSKRRIISIIILFILLVSVGSFCFSYFLTEGSFNGSTSITIPAFAPKVNNSYSINQSINLASTITNNKSLSPGAEGKFKVDIDFTEVGSDVYYLVSFDRTNIPNNLHFYVDENYSEELISVEGVELTSNSNRVAEHFVYWKWIIDDREASNQNDSLYNGEEIVIPFTASVSQKIVGHGVIVNGYEVPTGRVNLVETHSGNNRGSFNMVLDLSTLTALDEYNIYFGINELNSNLHLYSDSSYQNEIDHISDIYDGINSEITKTIYWELETDNISTLSDGLYYIVY